MTRQSVENRGHGMTNSTYFSYRKQILAAASLIGMIVAQNATAQEQATRTEAATEPQTAPRGEEIVVTGSRIAGTKIRSEEHTSELQSLMRISYAVFCLKKKKQTI